MEKENKYDIHMENIKELVSIVGDFIEAHPNIQSMNFGLYHQHGRLGFVDLDAFAKATKVTTEDGTEQTLTELKQSIDKEEK